jgi:hypothetical protein
MAAAARSGGTEPSGAYAAMAVARVAEQLGLLGCFCSALPAGVTIHHGAPKPLLPWPVVCPGLEVLGLAAP